MSASSWIIVSAMGFILVIALRVLPWGRARRSPEVRKAFVEARARLRAARTPTDKAAALCELAEHSTAAHQPRRARSLYMRALKVDPSGTAALDGLCRTMREPSALPDLEHLLWRIVDARASDAQWSAARSALQSLYAGPLAHSPRADAIRALVKESPEGPASV